MLDKRLLIDYSSHQPVHCLPWPGLLRAAGEGELPTLLPLPLVRLEDSWR